MPVEGEHALAGLGVFPLGGKVFRGAQASFHHVAIPQRRKRLSRAQHTFEGSPLARADGGMWVR